MSRLPPTANSTISSEMQITYQRVTKVESGLPATFQALFANPQVASGLADLHELVGRTGLEPWVTLTVALTVAHERDNSALWDSFVPMARESGVSDAVIDGIAAGTASATRSSMALPLGRRPEGCFRKKGYGCTSRRRWSVARCATRPGKQQLTWWEMREPLVWPSRRATTR